MADKKRLIYAEDLLGSLKTKVCIIGGSRNGKTHALIEAILRKLIEIAPTIDAVPVVYGRWNGQHTAHCSICGRFCTLAYIEKYPNYCPNCGAKMDGGETE